jgi:hypothetical protein
MGTMGGQACDKFLADRGQTFIERRRREINPITCTFADKPANCFP